MIPFKPITLSDKKEITTYTLSSNSRNCDFSFANMCSWRFLYDSEYAIIDDSLLIRFYIEDRRPAYMMPLGNGSLEKMINLLDDDARSMGHTLCLLGITPEAKNQLEKILPGKFRFIPERDYFDYIYLRSDLAYLVGKKYQPKRNHINRFRQEYDNYRYTPLTLDIIPQCLELETKWCKENNCSDNEDLLNERRSMTYALQHFEELGIMGGAIW